MAARKTLDRRPGPLPEIRTDGESVFFAFTLLDVPNGRLVLRCDAAGELYAWIPDPEPADSAIPFTAGD